MNIIVATCVDSAPRRGIPDPPVSIKQATELPTAEPSNELWCPILKTGQILGWDDDSGFWKVGLLHNNWVKARGKPDVTVTLKT